MLVGIQLDQICDLGLFARHIRGKVADDLAPETTHDVFADSVKDGRNGIMALRFNLSKHFAASLHFTGFPT